MKINIKHKEEVTVKLSQLQTGQVFKHEGKYYLDVGYAHPEDSTYSSENTRWMAYNLIHNNYTWFFGSEDVTPVKDVSLNIND